MQRSARQCLERGGSLAGNQLSGKRGVDRMDEMQAMDDCWVWTVDVGVKRLRVSGRSRVSRSGGWACAGVGAGDGWKQDRLLTRGVKKEDLGEVPVSGVFSRSQGERSTRRRRRRRRRRDPTGIVQVRRPQRPATRNK